MIRFLAVGLALAVAALTPLRPERADASERTLPMRFELGRQSAADHCAEHCGLWIVASGAITADSLDDFKRFANGRDLSGATIALDSDGGSVLGAIALGRELRRLNITTTVGRAAEQRQGVKPIPAAISPKADCESMCVFVLLGGVRRIIPPEARVMVHQIWLGDRRDDPTAANYSAEDLVLVQRDIGRLAQYTADMGGAIELLDLALRIPPWEPMHQLTVAEMRRVHLDNADPGDRTPAETVASSPSQAKTLLPPATNGLHATAISERRWAVVDRDGGLVLARRHPLTLEGEEIGSFDLTVACADDGGYLMSYRENRYAGDRQPLPIALNAVDVRVGEQMASLRVASSERQSTPGELVTLASAKVPVALIDSFAAVGNHTITIATRSADASTSIRVGNTGVNQSLPQLSMRCEKALGNRADLTVKKTGAAEPAR